MEMTQEELTRIYRILENGFLWRNDPRPNHQNHKHEDDTLSECDCGWTGVEGDLMCHISDAEYERNKYPNPIVIGCCPMCGSWYGVVTHYPELEEEEES